MSSIGVLGLGNWGTALAHIWGQDGHNVNGWTIEQEVYESIVMDSVNSKYLPDTPLSGIDVTMDLADICATSEVLVLALQHRARRLAVAMDAADHVARLLGQQFGVNGMARR